MNFTRAAEVCHVAQPSLSRAIKQLEAELGGDLLRRERALTHLTDFGQAVLPALRQCYDGSQQARQLAKSYLKQGHAPLHLALSRSIELSLIAPMLAELTSAFPKIEIRIQRGPPHNILEQLKSGEAEIALAAPLGEGWDRLDARPLYQERFALMLNRTHSLARKGRIGLDDLLEERLLCRSDCDMADAIVRRMMATGAVGISTHVVPLVEDLVGLVRANFGIGVLPLTRAVPDDLSVGELDGVDLTRLIHVYTVAGRPHSSAAAALKTLLRAHDWTPGAGAPQPPAGRT